MIQKVSGQPGDGYDSDEDYEDSAATSPVAPLVLVQQQQDPAKEAFDRIIQDAIHNKLFLSKSDQRKTFAAKYQHFFDARVQPENQTLLHLVAWEVGHRHLTIFLVQRCSHLLHTRDDSGKTPLYTAIIRKNLNFLHVLLDKFAPGLDRLLAVQCEHGRNSIHAAIFHKLYDAAKLDKADAIKLTIKLIKHASKETLCMQDVDGLTPLHLAVHYDKCSDSQLRIVRELIAHGDGALDKFSSEPRGLSVYQYHQHTVKEAQQKSQVSLSRETSSTRSDAGLGKLGLKGKRREHDHEAVPQNENIVLVMRQSQHVNSHAPDETSKKLLLHDIPTTDRIQPDGFEPQRKPPLTTVRDHSFSRGSRPDHQAEKTIWADQIIQEVKMHYLRSTFQTASRPHPRDQGQALRFLHGANIQDLNLCFDYSKAASPVRWEFFEQSFEHMRFDNVLRYVAFGQIEIQKPPQKETIKPQTKRMPVQSKTGQGRTDLKQFFKWLRNKGVTHILKAIVHDAFDRPHNDHTIEGCLKQFEIENLEWRKLDLCPETLFNACRNVRHLHLWWSGNRAILRAWSEPEGLARLEELKAVTVLWNSAEVLEPVDEIYSYIESFKVRLARSVREFDLAKRAGDQQANSDELTKRTTGIEALDAKEEAALRSLQVEIIEDSVPRIANGASTGSQAKSLTAHNRGNLSAHRWLNCMDAFADEFQNFPVTPSPQHKDLRKDITIALIDYGVNLHTPTVAGKVIGGETFDRGGPGDNGPGPYFLSDSGHGTVMADMICRVCPTAKLYVFKLETHYSQDATVERQSHSQIVTRSAAQAVEAATARGVDIISISWTVKKPKDTEQDADLRKLGNAIKAALDAGILIFCAAGDAGNFSDQEYPYEFDRGRILRIGAATDDGRPWERSGDPHNLDFIFPGCGVVSRNARLEGAVPSEFRENTGSSVATALAAGLAALILNCVRLAAIVAEQKKEENDAGFLPAGAFNAAVSVDASHIKSLRAYRNMKTVFLKMGVDRDVHKFIEVWDRFEEPAARLKAAPERAGDIITNLALSFVVSLRAI